MKRARWSATMASAGALTMYFLDPDRGRRRRVLAKDCAVHAAYLMKRSLRRLRRDSMNRLEGVVAESKRPFRHEELSDETLTARIRTMLGRVVSHAHAIEVKCKEGCVELHGSVMTWELERLRREIEMVRGVRDLSSLLHTTEDAQEIPGPAGGTARRGGGKEQWSPTQRALFGTTGLALIASGLLRRRSLVSIEGVAGGLLVARSLANRPLRQAMQAGIHVEKTMRIHASRESLYAFWNNPENYPKVFSHVKRVTAEGNDVYRWHCVGTAGIPLSWAGSITKRVAGKSVEWRSLPESAIENHGIVHLDDEGNGSTRVHVQLEYAPPAGLLGHSLATLLGMDPRNVMHHDFVQLKSVMEQGVTRAHGHPVTIAELGIPPVPAAEPAKTMASAS